MSAFICDQEHIKQLALYAAAPGRRAVHPDYFRHPDLKALADPTIDWTARSVVTFYANILYRENIRSVEARYPEDAPFSDAITITRSDVEDHTLSAVDIISMCNCLDYQSCETDDWASTAAHELLAVIRKKATSMLPGMDGAYWEYTKHARDERTLAIKVKIDHAMAGRKA
ncbi:MAG: hypothetical protein ACOY2B_02215 [Pseudomonadota bacterium]